MSNSKSLSLLGASGIVAKTWLKWPRVFIVAMFVGHVGMLMVPTLRLFGSDWDVDVYMKYMEI